MTLRTPRWLQPGPFCSRCSAWRRAVVTANRYNGSYATHDRQLEGRRRQVDLGGVLACGLARAGRTLLIDADPQASVLSWSEQAGGFPFPVIAWATRDLARRVGEVADDYEHLVIDTGPSNELLLRQALAVTDQLLIPVSPTLLDAGRIGPTLDLVDDVATLHRVDARVLLTKVRAGTRSAQAARAGLAAMGLPLLAAQVALREQYAAAADTVPADLGEYEAVLAELRTPAVTR